MAQIEVTYELDANGILHVSAQDKASSRKNNITINNDKGRLSQADIDRMIEEAEKFKAEDKAQEEKVAAKQELENYCHQMLDCTDNTTYMSKLNNEEQEKLESACTDALEWVEHNEASVEKAQLNAKQREVELALKPLLAKMYAIDSNSNKKKRPQGNRRR